MSIAYVGRARVRRRARISRDPNGGCRRSRPALQALCHRRTRVCTFNAPAQVASCEGNLPIVEALLNTNANVNCHDRWSNSPLAEAVGLTLAAAAGLVSSSKAVARRLAATSLLPSVVVVDREDRS